MPRKVFLFFFLFFFLARLPFLFSLLAFGEVTA
jgi:hypothetical protein